MSAALLDRDGMPGVWRHSRPTPGIPLAHYQVFGERRSGTNYVNALVSENLKLKRTQRYGWKHGFPVMPVLPPQVLFVVVVRNPYDWVQSLFRNPYEVSGRMLSLDFSDFLRAPWKSRFRAKLQNWPRWGFSSTYSHRFSGGILQIDRHPLTGEAFANILEMRNLKNQGFLSFITRGTNVTYIRYEDVRDHPEAVMESLSDRFGLSRKGRFTPVTETVSPHMSKTRKAPLPHQMTDADIAHVNQWLNWETEAQLGFQKVDFGDFFKEDQPDTCGRNRG